MKKILVGTAAFGCMKGPSGAGKTEIPLQCSPPPPDNARRMDPVQHDFIERCRVPRAPPRWSTGNTRLFGVTFARVQTDCFGMPQLLTPRAVASPDPARYLLTTASLQRTGPRDPRYLGYATSACSNPGYQISDPLLASDDLDSNILDYDPVRPAEYECHGPSVLKQVQGRKATCGP